MNTKYVYCVVYENGAYITFDTYDEAKKAYDNYDCELYYVTERNCRPTAMRQTTHDYSCSIETHIVDDDGNYIDTEEWLDYKVYGSIEYDQDHE